MYAWKNGPSIEFAFFWVKNIFACTHACCGHSCVLVQSSVVRFITGGVAADQAAQDEQRGEAEDVHGGV